MAVDGKLIDWLMCFNVCYHYYVGSFRVTRGETDGPKLRSGELSSSATSHFSMQTSTRQEAVINAASAHCHQYETCRKTWEGRDRAIVHKGRQKHTSHSQNLGTERAGNDSHHLCARVSGEAADITD